MLSDTQQLASSNKTSQGPRAEKKKFSPSCTAFQLKSGRIFLAAVVLGCRLIHVLGSPQRQVCLTIAVRPDRRVSLTLCRNDDVAVSFLISLARGAVREFTLILAEGAGEKIKTGEPQTSCGE